MKSPKELSIEKKILDELVPGSRSRAVAEALMGDDEVQEMQEYANTVSIVRLGYNDHGPVHMRTVTRNAVHMLSLLHQAGIGPTPAGEAVFQAELGDAVPDQQQGGGLAEIRLRPADDDRDDGRGPRHGS